MFLSEGHTHSLSALAEVELSVEVLERRCRVLFSFKNNFLRAVRLLLLLCNPCGTPSGVCASGLLTLLTVARCCCSAWL